MELPDFCPRSGPVDLLIITKMLQTIQEKYGNILDKYYFRQSGTHIFLKIFEHVHPGYHVCSFCSSFCFLVFSWNSEYIFQTYFCNLVARSGKDKGPIMLGYASARSRISVGSVARIVNKQSLQMDTCIYVYIFICM